MYVYIYIYIYIYTYTSVLDWRGRIGGPPWTRAALSMLVIYVSTIYASNTLIILVL